MSSPIHHLGGKWPDSQTRLLEVGRCYLLTMWRINWLLKDGEIDAIVSVPHDRVKVGYKSVIIKSELS